MATIRFGTDGWRGLIARDFTFDNVALCAQGVANYLAQEGLAKKGLVVGYDTRFLSEDFAACVAEVMAGNRIVTYLARAAAPTPVISYNILHHQAGGAVIITASHNPAAWNGFKYKPDYAGSASPEVIARLEAEIDSAEASGVVSMPLAVAEAEGLVRYIDPMPPYIAHIQRLVDLESISKSGLKVVVDSMHGAGAGYVPALLYGAGSDEGSTVRCGQTERLLLAQINTERNPAFPGMERPEPIGPNLTRLASLVVESNADVGLAFDGDADRLGIIDEKGTYITTLQAFALLVLYLLEVKGEKGALVKALTMTSMVQKLGQRFGVPVFETPVGFKYICPIMLRENALTGGEESGGYGFRGHIPERDGILSGLLMLEYMVRTGKRPSELLEHLYDVVGPHYYDRRDISFAPERKQELQRELEDSAPDRIGGIPVASTDAIDGRRFLFASGAWLLTRFSGTEPLLRIYAESESPEMVAQLLDGAESFLGL